MTLANPTPGTALSEPGGQMLTIDRVIQETDDAVSLVFGIDDIVDGYILARQAKPTSDPLKVQLS